MTLHFTNLTNDLTLQFFNSFTFRRSRDAESLENIAMRSSDSAPSTPEDNINVVVRYVSFKFLYFTVNLVSFNPWTHPFEIISKSFPEEISFFVTLWMSSRGNMSVLIDLRMCVFPECDHSMKKNAEDWIRKWFRFLGMAKFW